MVPAAHISVQMAAWQAGACPRGTHALAWQQTAGRQSSSRAQSAPAAVGGEFVPGGRDEEVVVEVVDVVQAATKIETSVDRQARG